MQTNHTGTGFTDKLHFWGQLPPQISEAESLRLIEEFKKTGDRKLLDRVVYGNLRFLRETVRETFGNVDEDFLQQASLALVGAVNTFNLTRERHFKTHLRQYLQKKRTKANLEALQWEQEHGVVRTNSAQAPEVEFYCGDLDESEDEKFCDNGLVEEKIMNRLEMRFIREHYLKYLGPKEREFFRLYYIRHLSLGQIARKYGCSRQAVMSTLCGISKKIKKLFDETDAKKVEMRKSFVAKNGSVYGPDGVNNILKGFKSRDAKIFVEYYQDRVPVEEISKKYGLSAQYTEQILSHIYKKITNTVRPATFEKKSAEAELKIKNQKTDKMRFEEAEKYLPLFDLTDQQVFTEYHLHGLTQSEIARVHGMKPFEIFEILNDMNGKMMLIKTQGLEKMLELEKKSGIIKRAILTMNEGRKLSVVDVKKFMGKLSPEEQTTFVKFMQAKSPNHGKNNGQ